MSTAPSVTTGRMRSADLVASQCSISRFTHGEFAASGLTQPVIVPFAPPGADRGALLRTLRTFP